MTGIEIVLLLIGVIFMIGSFMVTEKLSASEVNKINELSESEIDKIVEHSLQKANTQIEEAIETQIADSVDKVDRALEKETNEKIMAISEYSDTVVEAMNKTHNEIMFLYSMLNDKHTDLTNLSGELQGLLSEAKKTGEELGRTMTKEDFFDTKEDAKEEFFQEKLLQDKIEEEIAMEVDSDTGNHNMDVLKLHKEGYSDVQIAQALDIGIGEVKLVIGLFKGERK